MRLLIRKSEIMLITGWGRGKAGYITARIKDAYAYPPHCNDIRVKDLCDYCEFNEKDVQELLSKITI